MDKRDLVKFEKYFIDQWELIGVEPGHLLDETKVKLSSEIVFKYEVQKLAWNAAIYYERKLPSSDITPEFSKIGSMNDKDKEAFEKSLDVVCDKENDYQRFYAVWQTACEYKEIETVKWVIEKLRSLKSWEKSKWSHSRSIDFSPVELSDYILIEWKKCRSKNER